MTPLVEKAKRFATEAHGDQQYGDHRYVYHLGMVYDTLCNRDIRDEHMLCAAWLHDTIEDTDVTFDDVFREFGRNIARIVFAVTNEPGKNRRERHERTYPKIKAAGRSAIAVKLADRIANTRHSLHHNHGMLKMYQKEYAGFREALHLPGELKELWAELDGLMNHRVE